MDKLKITLKEGSDMLNCSIYYNSQLDPLSNVDREEVFLDSIDSMITQSFFDSATSSFTSCTKWNTIVLEALDLDDSILNTLSYTKTQMESEIASTPFANKGEWTEEKYQLLKV
jgi:hypothetical protein